jgi:type II secretory pathway pseudopilin PulG
MTGPSPDVPDSRAGAPEAGKKSNAFVIAIVIVGILGGGCVLLGIVTALLVPVFMRVRDKAFETNARTWLRAAAVAEQEYRQDNGRYSGNLKELRVVVIEEDTHGWTFLVESADKNHFVIVGTPPEGSRAKPLSLDETGRMHGGFGP